MLILRIHCWTPTRLLTRPLFIVLLTFFYVDYERISKQIELMLFLSAIKTHMVFINCGYVIKDFSLSFYKREELSSW